MPLLRWDQIDQMVAPEPLPRLIHAKGLLETDIPGRRTFALQIRDNSMQPLFSEGEIIFVNPELSGEPGEYVVVESEPGGPEGALLRQLKKSEGRLFFIHSTGGMKISPRRNTSASGAGSCGYGRIFEDCLMATPELLTPSPSHRMQPYCPLLRASSEAHSGRARSASTEGRLVAHLLSFIARSTSRLASRVLMVSRRSCSFLPLANPSSTLARPRLEK